MNARQNISCYCRSTPAKDKGGMKSVGLSEYAKHALKEICSQEWVREKFLKNPDILFTPDLLLDKMLSNKQVRICRKNATLFKILLRIDIKTQMK